MHLRSFAVRNFRRLRHVHIDLANKTTVFVGANNSGKTSAMHILQLCMGTSGRFTIHDFSAECWSEFDRFDPAVEETRLPVITLDLWFDVDEANLHRVIELLPDLEWEQTDPVGIRIAFEPRDPVALHSNYLAVKSAADSATSHWPKSVYDYLRRRLDSEYHLTYYKLDHRAADSPDETPAAEGPHRLDNGRAILRSIVRVDTVQAQRHLSDMDRRGRDEDLSTTLARYYDRYLDKPSPDATALQALAQSEQQLNVHYTKVFQPILEQLQKLGYPGFTDPELTIRSELDGDSILRSGAQVHYVVPGEPVDQIDGSPITLPDRYNGLGFKNLIYMVVEIIAAHRARIETEVATPPVHLIMIEEPEAHLHVQLQQVFIGQLSSILAGTESDPGTTQFILTTHSPHIVHADFTSIRYFARIGAEGTFHHSEVRDLSVFYDDIAEQSRKFLLQYLKLTHCDLFFADAAMLVEGNVERLLLPLLISKVSPPLENSHLTILELGGAFAHKFKKLIDFLGMNCLVITDLDSVVGPSSNTKACTTDKRGAVTANQTLRQWIPGKAAIDELLAVKYEDKAAAGPLSTTRVAYQTPVSITWNSTTKTIAGRTFEEAFAFENLDWSQDAANANYKLRVDDDARSGDLDSLIQAIFDRIRHIDKTDFALTVIELDGNWTCPAYITEGLEWLADEISHLDTAVPAELEAADEPPTPQS
ncbi:putative ATP-dependent endonuclease of OLD family [Kribbella sp. VKM Ac-2527]|uniref:Putative ATP-dependent endonuclease of OLD family n=1 Tax=Kribbella caucasensis TaxID=2512215 RepID=A0A4R6KKP9_9ACTN|nr:AAA family ATPase [Kribbella sp. VKM Ac-2527]TDO51561.1 putative ATP-dependent endonuclease of OLD family [Kribbella sp. VKM Ac-2527]